MPQYLVSFDQQWVGDHPAEWYDARGPLARAVMDDLRSEGALVFAGGLEEEDGPVWAADPTADPGGEVVVTEGWYGGPRSAFLGGFCVIDVADDETAQAWAARVAEACGWPQELRRFKG